MAREQSRLQSLLTTSDCELVIGTLQNEAARLRLLARGMRGKDNRQWINISSAADNVDNIIRMLNAPFLVVPRDRVA